jgi:hypothetical protein
VADRLGDAGGRPQKEPRYAPIFVAASLTGLYTQRHVFHDPSNVVTQRFYGGRPDTLFDGLNVELSNELTIIRRFGTVPVTTLYAQSPLAMFQWETNSGQLIAMVDTASVLYQEPFNGAPPTAILTKTGGGQGYFVASGNTLYYGDGVDLIKYTPGNPNGITWNWGIAPPMSPPSVTVVASGSSAVAWAAATVFSTMGLLVDNNGNVQQLFSVNANPNSPNSTQIGLSGNGVPIFNIAYAATTTDGSVTWTSQGQISLWTPHTLYQPGNCIFDPGTNCLFISSHSTAVTSGATRPDFTSTLGLSGARVTEPSGAKWENIGQVGVSPTAVTTWSKNTAFSQYQLPASGTDPTNTNSAIVFPLIPFVSSNGQLCNGQATYLLGASTAGTTANASFTPWTGIPSQSIGQITDDNQLAWICQGPAAWAPSTSYTAWVNGNSTFSAIKDQAGLMHVCIGSGQSGAVEPSTTATLTAASAASGGNTTYTGTFTVPFTAGQRVLITGFTNAGNNGRFTIVSGTTTHLVVANPAGVAETHSGTATFNPWGNVYGAQSSDGTVIWVCVGLPVAWTANTNWFLPSVGFAPPQVGQQFGGAEVIGSGFVQAVVRSGLSGSVAPTWPTAAGTLVTDNTIIWETVAPQSAQSITWQKSHVYAYSFKCRTPTDPYVTTSLLTFGGLNTAPSLTSLGNVPGLVSPLGPYLGGGTGVVSSASPVFTIPTPDTGGAVNTITGFGSTDPQVDTIVIWRDADGGGPSNMFELVEIPAPAPIAGQAQSWIFKDFLPDIATTTAGINFPGLDILAPAPIDGQNDPPPAGFLPLCDQLHFSRIWGAQGNTVFHSSGPDSLVGNGDEQFNAGNDDFPFKSTVVACIHSPAGLICPTTTDFECIYGGPSTSTFFSQNMLKGIGLLNYNSWDRVGGEIFFFSPDLQLWALNPSLQVARIGFPIADQFLEQPFNQAGAFSITAHENGTDNGIYVAGGGGGYFRLNPHQVGADIGGENAACWSPYATLGNNAAVGVMKSMYLNISGVTARYLMMGGPGTGTAIVCRCAGPPSGLNAGNPIFSDSGGAYSSFFEIGAITMVFPGQRAAVKFIEFDFMPSGTAPIVSYAMDDPGEPPSWVTLTNFVYDPPVKYAGTAIAPPYFPNRYYLSQNAAVAIGRRIRLKVDFGASDTVRNELISFSIWGKKYVEQ